MKHVLQILGYKVYDFPEFCLKTGKQWGDWHQEPDEHKKTKILQKMYKNVDAVVDMPNYSFWEELMVAFPDAKCIFYERPEDEWMVSFEKQMNSLKDIQFIPDKLQMLIMYWILFCEGRFEKQRLIFYSTGSFFRSTIL